LKETLDNDSSYSISCQIVKEKFRPTYEEQRKKVNKKLLELDKLVEQIKKKKFE